MTFNIEADPREMRSVTMENAWVSGPYMQAIGEYRATLKDHPNPPPPNVVNF
jgi:arylsulfatase